MGNCPGRIDQGRHLCGYIFPDELVSFGIQVIKPQGKNIEPVPDVIMNHDRDPFALFFLSPDIFQHQAFLMMYFCFILGIFFFDNPGNEST
ncbi:di/tri peptide transporter 2, partial [Corchorus olitorius]